MISTGYGFVSLCGAPHVSEITHVFRYNDLIGREIEHRHIAEGSELQGVQRDAAVKNGLLADATKGHKLKGSSRDEAVAAFLRSLRADR
jgi:hypothetical protein